MFKKTNKPTKPISKKKKLIQPVKQAKPILTKSAETPITENLKLKVLPHIVNDFAQALKDLENGESIYFGKLGLFKKSQRQVNGYTGYQYSFKAGKILKS